MLTFLCWRESAQRRNRNALKSSQRDYTGLHNKKLPKWSSGRRVKEGEGREGDSKATLLESKRIWEVRRVTKSRAKLQEKKGDFKKVIVGFD